MHRFFIFCLLFTFSLRANEIAYAQNNVPGTHCSTGNVFRENPILVTIDVIYGQVQSNQVVIGIHTKSGSPDRFQTLVFPNEAKVGFRGSLGMSIGDGSLHISGVYTRLTSGDTLSDPILLGGSDVFIFGLPGSTQVNLSNTQITFFREQHLRYQTIDFLVQTARFMLGSRTRFQPLVGGRYLNLYQNRTLKITEQTDVTMGQNLCKLHGIGTFIGTDLRFIVSPAFHFFGNVLVGLLGGTERNSGKGADFTTRETITYSESYNLTLNPFWEVRFGMAATHLFPSGVMLSLRLAYELLSFMHAQGQDDVEFSVASGETVGIKVQAGTLGLLFVF